MCRTNNLLKLIIVLLFLFVLFCCKGGGSQSESGSQTENGTGSDTNPPILSGGSPAGTLPSDTTQTTLSLISDENAICKYDNVPEIDYESMKNTCQSTGGTSHSTTISGLQDGRSYTYFVRCQDDSGNANLNDYTILFEVGHGTPTVTISHMYTMAAGNKLHSTARGTVDLVHRFQNTWFVFHGASVDPCCSKNGFQTSSDGISWSGLKTGTNATMEELARSYLIEGNTITRLYPWNGSLYISEGTFSGQTIVWNFPVLVINGAYYYYNDMKRDSLGRLHFSGRYNNGSFTSIFWMRARDPYDITSWEDPIIIVQGDSDTGVDAHENLQLFSLALPE